MYYAPRGRKKTSQQKEWTVWDLNPRPPACKAGDLPADLTAHRGTADVSRNRTIDMRNKYLSIDVLSTEVRCGQGATFIVCNRACAHTEASWLRGDRLYTLGKKLRFSLFGKSHGPCVGCVLEGVPQGTPIDMESLADRKSTRLNSSH